MKKGILVITGPTATGKTALGVELAKRLSGEVVSADAMQLYRDMVIGTAAPTPEEMDGVPHHLVGTVDPRENYSVGRYVAEATEAVEDILRRGKLPILVGGTNLYIQALLRGTDFAAMDPELRRELEADFDRLGADAMLRRLGTLDPERADKLHVNDRKRIIRALEVCILTGETMTELDRRSREAPPRYPSCTVALSFENREDLYRRIDLRVDRMLEAGLVREVEALLRQGVTEKDTSLQAIGYKEIVQALRGECTMEQARLNIQQGSRRYAKRQLSWLRGQADVQWYLWKKETNFLEASLFSTQKMEESGII